MISWERGIELSNVWSGNDIVQMKSYKVRVMWNASSTGILLRYILNLPRPLILPLFVYLHVTVAAISITITITSLWHILFMDPISNLYALCTYDSFIIFEEYNFVMANCCFQRSHAEHSLNSCIEHESMHMNILKLMWAQSVCVCVWKISCNFKCADFHAPSSFSLHLF